MADPPLLPTLPCLALGGQARHRLKMRGWEDRQAWSVRPASSRHWCVSGRLSRRAALQVAYAPSSCHRLRKLCFFPLSVPSGLGWGLLPTVFISGELNLSGCFLLIYPLFFPKTFLRFSFQSCEVRSPSHRERLKIPPT